MDQSKKKVVSINQESQFQFLGRWVNKAHFRTFVYDKNGDQKLANSYEEYESLTTSGLWFASKPDASKVERKQKHDTLRTAS